MYLDHSHSKQVKEMFSDLDYASQVATCIKLVYKRGLTSSTGGNVSIKDEDGSIWMTPSV